MTDKLGINTGTLDNPFEDITKRDLLKRLQELIEDGLSQVDTLLAFAQPDHPAVIRARMEIGNTELEIDHHAPLISETDEGTWVSAWVWVPVETVED